MMDNTKRIYKIVSLGGNISTEFFGVGFNEIYPVAEAKDFGAPPCEFQRFVRNIDGRHMRSGAGKVDRIGSYAAAYLKNTFSTPPIEFGKTRYMRFDKILSRLDLVEIPLGPDLSLRMPDIAGPGVPVISYVLN